MTSPDPPTTSATAADRSAAVRSRRLLVVANPHASTTTDAMLRSVVGVLAERHRVESAVTRHAGHAIELCLAAVRESYDAVVVLGGDGTINEAANGLAGSRTALAPLAGGATNVYARMLGVAGDPLVAARRIARMGSAAERSVDVARVNDRWFTFAAGVGLDASVVERVDRHPRRKARWGPWFFAGTGLAVFLGRYLRDPPQLEVQVGGRALPAVTVLMQNGNPYTYFARRPIVLDPAGGLQSAHLGGVALTRARALDLPPVLWRALSGRRPVTEHPQVEALRTRDSLLVRSVDGRPVPVQVDGDHIGDALEASFTLTPGGLRVLA